LIAIERYDQRMTALTRRLAARDVSAHIPTAVIAQVWRGSARQHALIRLIGGDAVRVEPLTEEAARHVGQLLAASGTSDVVDGHVAVLAQSLQAAVVTSDPKDLNRLDPSLELIAL
jgi:predicted nucleic acid-binding protein